MTEKLLQYIWEFGYFNNSALRTTAGEELQILFPGRLNANQGPDFINARIQIDNTILAGSIEIHLKTSQWNEHGHSDDENYKNVILHIVLENDVEQSPIPVLELQSRISRMMLHKYESMMKASTLIACGDSIYEINDILWIGWKDRMLVERLTRKSFAVFKFLAQNDTHWEESFWWTLARNFGMKVNADAFEAVARTISVTRLAKHKTQIHQLEALLLGQAGLLNENFDEEYPRLLQREYDFLQKKYRLKPIHVPVHFLRMRPGNFPTIRLAQLAALIQNSAHLFSKILEIENLSEVKKLFDVTANDYWHYHYRFDEASAFKKKTIGKNMVDNIIINTVVPVLFAYGLYHDETKLKSKAMQWLEELSGEINAITKGFSQLNLPSKNAFDSQAFIELKTQYCDSKHCLQCTIGNAILKNEKYFIEIA